MKKSTDVRRLVLLGLLTALLLVMSYTPLGYLNIGPLAITLNVIPVAIAAISVGPAAGAVIGAVFGITSFLQCIGVGGTSAMGVILFDINPLFAFVQRFVPRLLVGLLTGLIYKAVKKLAGPRISCFIAGFCCPFLNTLLFMSALVLLFGSTDYVQGLMGGQNFIVFVCAFVGINAVFEMLACTVVSGAVCSALINAGLAIDKKSAKRR